MQYYIINHDGDIVKRVRSIKSGIKFMLKLNSEWLKRVGVMAPTHRLVNEKGKEICRNDNGIY